MKKLLSSLIIFFFVNHVNAQWQSVGPFGATVNCLAVKGNYIFAGIPNAGIYMSSDNGNTWTSVNNGVNIQRSVYSLAIKGDSIYAGTMTINQDHKGILFSSDNGNSWTGIGDSISVKCFSLAFIGNRIIAGTEDHGIRYSDDHGATWHVSDFYFYDLDNVKSLIVKDSIIFAGTNDGLYLSTDSGATWGRQNNTLPPQFGFGVSVSALAMKNNTLYIADNNWVFKSTDYGENWSSVGYTSVYDIKALVFKGDTLIAGVEDGGVFLSVNNGINLVNIYNGSTPYNHNVLSLALKDNIILAGTNITGIIASHNNGITWSESNAGMPALLVSSTTTIGNNLIASTSAGTHLSQDNGNTWQYLNTGISGLDYFTAFNKSGADLYGVAGQIYHSGDMGYTWARLNTDTFYLTWPIKSMAVSGNMFYAIDDYDVLFSTDYGQTFINLVPSILDYNSGYESVIFHNGKTYVGNHYYGCYVSGDNGVNWVQQNTGLPWSPTYANTMASNGNSLFIGLNNGRIYRSTNDGQSWSWAATGITGGGTITSLLPMGNNILAQYDSSGYAGRSQLSFSNNNGTLWTDADQGMPASTNLYSALSVNEEYFFTGGYHGVHRRPISELITGWVGCSAAFSLYPDTNLQHNWFLIADITGTQPFSYFWQWGDGATSTGSNPSHTYSTPGNYNICLTITDENGCSSFYCDSSTYVYKTENMISVNVVDQLPNGIEEETEINSLLIYPNPASSSIVINGEWTMNNGQLKIINTQGQLVFQSAINNQQLTIDVSMLSPGIYFLSLSDGEKTVNRKFVKE